MSWLYQQSTGELLKPDSTRLAFGFSGNGLGLNNPSAEDQHSVGPLPQGKYKLAAWIQSHPTMGLCVIELIPEDPTTQFGRSGFFIHGSVNLDAAGLTAFLKSSDGCIVIGNCATRLSIWQSQDRELQVIA